MTDHDPAALKAALREAAIANGFVDPDDPARYIDPESVRFIADADRLVRELGRERPWLKSVPGDPFGRSRLGLREDDGRPHGEDGRFIAAPPVPHDPGPRTHDPLTGKFVRAPVDGPDHPMNVALRAAARAEDPDPRLPRATAAHEPPAQTDGAAFNRAVGRLARDVSHDTLEDAVKHRRDGMFLSIQDPLESK